MRAFLIAFLLIFLAELGDKSQLVALWFATRIRWWVVLAGVTAATLLVHLGSTALGASAADFLPEAAVLTIVGLSFYAFAVWGLLGDRFEGREAMVASGVLASLWLVTAAFFVSELGDKTQLATVAIAGREPGFVAVWLGSTAGMVAADAAAIGVGTLAGRRLPQRPAAFIAAVVFGAFGTAALVRAAVLGLE
jgi:putative Ca2+/H+ antiporter (TMEM165/GDT1 family)